MLVSLCEIAMPRGKSQIEFITDVEGRLGLADHLSDPSFQHDVHVVSDTALHGSAAHMSQQRFVIEHGETGTNSIPAGDAFSLAWHMQAIGSTSYVSLTGAAFCTGMVRRAVLSFELFPLDSYSTAGADWLASSCDPVASLRFR